MTKRHKLSVTAVIGVILMVAITVAIASTVYYYVATIDEIHTKGILIKEGRVVHIEYDVIFGGCFTDWRHEIYFDDGSILWTDSDDNLTCIQYNLTGIYKFEKNYFYYEECFYKFHDFIEVEYLE